MNNPPTTIVPSSIRRGAAIVAAAAILASCGSDSGDGASVDGEAQAQSVGVAREFCESIEVARASMDDAVQNQAGFGNARADTEAITEVLPDGAPGDVEDFFDNLAEWIGLVDDFAQQPDDGQPLDTDDIAEKFARTDHDVVEDFIEDECPEIAITQNEALGAMLVDSPFGATANTSADTNTEATVDPIDGSTPVETTTTTLPPPVPATKNVLAEDGPAAEYEAVTVDIEQIVSTDASVDDYFDLDEPEAQDEASLLVEVYFETQTDASNAFDQSDFLLTGPNGRSVAAEQTTDRRGDAERISLTGRSGAEVVLVFPTDEVLSDLTDWTLSIERDERIPEIIDLDGVDESIETNLELAAGATGQTITPTTSGACIDTYDTEIVSASAAIEAVSDRGDTVRVPRDVRYVEIAIDLTNVTDTGDQESPDYLCNIATGQAFAFANVRLVIDGRPVTHTYSDAVARVDVGATEMFRYVYEVPVDATDLVLIGADDDDVLGSWTVDLPVARDE